MPDIKYFGETDDTQWGVYQITCLTCLNHWVAVAPLYFDFECHHCGNSNLEFDTTDNRLCSPPGRDNFEVYSS